MSRLALFFALTLLFTSPFASAEIPHLISLQGKLTDATDNPISSSTNFVFRIFPSETGGSALWTEVQTIAPDTLGIFSALLGSVTALNIPFNESYWLEVEVNSEVLSPRTRMGSAGYALRSESPWNTTGNNIYTTNSGNVGIGTSVPGEKLDITGNVRIANGGWLKFNAASDSGVDLGFGTQLLRMGSDGRMKFNSQNSVFEFNGNVGIGTASIDGMLTIDGGRASIRSGNRLYFRPSTNDWDWNIYSIGAQPNNKLFINSGGDGATIMTLQQSGGNVGIGTTSPDPAAKLDVNGQIKIRGGSPAYGRVLTSDANGLASWQGVTIYREPSVTIRNSHDAYAQTNSIAYTKLKTITLNQDFLGGMRIYFEGLGDSGTGYARIYKNGVPWGTERTFGGAWGGVDEDFTGLNLPTGTTIELWAHGATGNYAYVHNFRLKYDVVTVVSTTNS